MPPKAKLKAAAGGSRKRRLTAASSAGGRRGNAAVAGGAGPSILTIFNDDLLVAVASWLDAKSLGRLACTAKRFADRTADESGQPGVVTPQLERPRKKGGTKAQRRTARVGEPPVQLQLRSLVDVAVRIGVQRQEPHVRAMSALPLTAASWLPVLASLEAFSRPLRFSLATGTIQVSGCRAKVAAAKVRAPGIAVCQAVVMRSGIHRAEFTICRNLSNPLSEGNRRDIDPNGNASINRGRLQPLLTIGLVCAASAHAKGTAAGWASETGAGYGMYASSGVLQHGGLLFGWAGRTSFCNRGDVVALELDLRPETKGVLTGEDCATTPFPCLLSCIFRGTNLPHRHIGLSAAHRVRSQ
jgi:hypothetical protein